MNWTTEQINTIGLTGGWVVEYADYLPGWHTTIYVSVRFFDHHMKHGITTTSITCLYPWEK